ncbi:MAG TPA: DUF3857 domain-containing protein [Candidatus Acidoferrum sp.]|nr:DUF3857 domain-containing protein [Candidatus Acidoferrum sp.]
MSLTRAIQICMRFLIAPYFVLALWTGSSSAQEPSQKPAEKPSEVSAEKPSSKSAPENPAQIELLETKVRFEANGDSRKEVHAHVRINSELGVRQFARLNFDFNRAFESIEIPLVHITHPSGGTADILPSAITDQPNPAVLDAPAYHDVRVKSVRILGLEPGDFLEYRVITTVSHHPLAPDFWLDHSFDRTGVVTQEIFELELPDSRKPAVRINPATPPRSIEKSAEGDSVMATYRWEIAATATAAPLASGSKDSSEAEPDVVLSTGNWLMLSGHIDGSLTPGARLLESMGTLEASLKEASRRQHKIDPEVAAKAAELTRATHTTRAMVEALYDFVSQKIATVDLPLGATGFVAKPAKEILASGYATQEDKFVLFAALVAAAKLGAEAGLTGYCNERGLPRPTVFKHLLIRSGDSKGYLSWTDPSLEVAPFGVVPGNSGNCVFVLNRGFLFLSSVGHEWEKLETDPPFPSHQRVSINAVVSSDGALKSKVHYSMRGQNELLLRVAFHQSAKEKWKDVAQLLSISDGFRGKVSSVTASDPYATREPFTVDYEITMPKFVDWSKERVHIPALLPQLGLPDPPGKSAAGAKPSPIELGTPLEVTTSMTLQLPPGTKVQAPTGTSVQRDYATFASQYSAKGQALTASRHISFLLRQIPGNRAVDYNAFLRAVQSDEAEVFTIERETPPTSNPRPAPSKSRATPRP